MNAFFGVQVVSEKEQTCRGVARNMLTGKITTWHGTDTSHVPRAKPSSPTKMDFPAQQPHFHKRKEMQ